MASYRNKLRDLQGYKGKDIKIRLAVAGLDSGTEQKPTVMVQVWLFAGPTNIIDNISHKWRKIASVQKIQI